MAVAIRRVDATIAPPSAPAPAQIPLALLHLMPALVRAMRASAPARSGRVGRMSAYHLGWTDAEGRPADAGGGKFLRGCLTLWAAERCGGSPDAALPAAAAVEWIHNFTLVHDDIQDGDRERRHRPTVWVIWGAAQAINAGDGMHANAYRALLCGSGRSQARLRAAATLNTAVLAVIEGQCLDLALEGRVDTTVSTYLRLARGKTGALIGGALGAGAVMGGARSAQADLLRRAGVELGVAFQVRDDWLGMWGDQAVTGKANDGDLERRKLTYPVVAALQRLAGPARRELKQLYRSRGDSSDRIRALLDEAGARAAVAAELESRGALAVELVRRSGMAGGAVADFESIVHFVTARTA